MMDAPKVLMGSRQDPVGSLQSAVGSRPTDLPFDPETVDLDALLKRLHLASLSVASHPGIPALARVELQYQNGGPANVLLGSLTCVLLLSACRAGWGDVGVSRRARPARPFKE